MDAIDGSLLMRAVRGEVTERPPVWFMRQAGRSDPEYRSLRERVPLRLEDLFRTPDIAGKVSLLPARWGVDALIIFLDILSPLEPMGAPFIFRTGPQLKAPVRTIQDLLKLHEFDPSEKMAYVAETFALMRKEACPSMPMIGFAGAPLTLVAFLAEGGSPGTKLVRTREFLKNYPKEMHRVLDLLTNTVLRFLKFQHACGAHVVQLFESCAHLFTKDEYLEFALPCQQRILDALRGSVPSIFFARVSDDCIPMKVLAAAGADVVSLSTTRLISDVRAEIGSSTVIQGNLDNRLLASGPIDSILESTRACLEAGESRGHIFNLNHGILADTPHNHIIRVVDYVRSYKRPTEKS